MKCRWTHCKHPDTEVTEDNGIKIGKSSWYHKDCYEERSEINSILDLWSEQIDIGVNFNQLRSVVNKLIYERKYPVGYVKYIVQCGARGGWLHYPMGLFTAVKDDKKFNEWKRIEAHEKVSNIEFKAEDIYAQPSSDIGYTANKRSRGFRSIING